MTIAFTCVLISTLMPLLWTFISKWPAFIHKTYDNRSPRLLAEQLTGVAQRAHWAQQNSFEALPGFIAAVIIASITQAPQASVDTLACIFIIARLAYGLCYILNWHIARSSVWGIGFASMLGIFVLCY